MGKVDWALCTLTHTIRSWLTQLKASRKSLRNLSAFLMKPTCCTLRLATSGVLAVKHGILSLRSRKTYQGATGFLPSVQISVGS